MKTTLLSVTPQNLDSLQPGDTFISADKLSCGKHSDADVFIVVQGASLFYGEGYVACVKLENGKFCEANGSNAVIRVTPTDPLAFKVAGVCDV